MRKPAPDDRAAAAVVSGTGNAMRFSLLCIVMLLLPAAAIAQNGSERIIQGEATVLNGDTLLVNGERVRLFGITAAEMHNWPWGPFARAALDEMAHGKQVSCIVAERKRARRAVARCTLPDDSRYRDTTLGEVMIRSGWATHQRLVTHGTEPRSLIERYDAAESEAQARKLGIWGAR